MQCLAGGRGAVRIVRQLSGNLVGHLLQPLGQLAFKPVELGILRGKDFSRAAAAITLRNLGAEALAGPEGVVWPLSSMVAVSNVLRTTGRRLPQRIHTGEHAKTSERPTAFRPREPNESCQCTLRPDAANTQRRDAFSASVRSL